MQHETSAVLDLNAIKGLIPHRAPFLFVHQAEIPSPHVAHGQARWAMDDPILQGHFPQEKIVPGVLIVEAVAQLGGLLISHQQSLLADKTDRGVAVEGFLSIIRKASFHSVLHPNVTLVMQGSGRAINSRTYSFEAECAQEDGQLVSRVEVILTYRPSPPPIQVPQHQALYIERVR